MGKITDGLSLFVDEYAKKEPYLDQNGNVRYYFVGSIAMMLLSKVKSFHTLKLNDVGNIINTSEKTIDINDKARLEYAKSERRIHDIDIIYITNGVTNPNAVFSRYASDYGLSTNNSGAPLDVLSDDIKIKSHIISKCELENGEIIYMKHPAAMVFHKMFDIMARFTVIKKFKAKGKNTDNIEKEINKRLGDLICLIKGLVSYDKDFIKSIIETYNVEFSLENCLSESRNFESKDFNELLNLIYKSGLVSEEEQEVFKKIIYQVQDEQQKREKLDVITDKNGQKYFIKKCYTKVDNIVGRYQSSIKYEIWNNNGDIVGKITLSSVGNPNSAEIEYYINSDYRGKGLASASLKYVVTDVYENGVLDGLHVSHKGENIITNIGEIFLSINNNNLSSKHVAINNGFNCEQSNNVQIYTLSRNDYFDHKALINQDNGLTEKS